MMRGNRFTSAALLTLLFSIPALAQHEGHAAPAPAAAKGFRAEAVAQIQGIETKLVDLAGAMPADKWDWRPAEGVRSVGEVYAHVAGGNYFLLSLAGVKPPAGIDVQKLETSLKGKDKTIAAMKDSFAFVYAEIGKMSDADLEKALKVFGRDTTVRGIVMFTVEHNSEHLGQSIAYARMNGVTPPWSKKGD
jgi:uncharacterized damage-inducible protein DinB